jgi:protease I
MRALIISADGFEDAELLQPVEELRRVNVAIDIASVEPGPIRGKRGAVVEANLAVTDADPSSYDLLLLPGGRAPSRLRKVPAVLEFVRRFHARGKPIAAICHGPQILISAELVRGRRATAYKAVAGELKEAGAKYLDEEMVADGNLLTSRTPADLPAFIRAIKRELGISS